MFLTAFRLWFQKIILFFFCGYRISVYYYMSVIFCGAHTYVNYFYIRSTFKVNNIFFFKKNFFCQKLNEKKKKKKNIIHLMKC